MSERPNLTRQARFDGAVYGVRERHKTVGGWLRRPALAGLLCLGLAASGAGGQDPMAAGAAALQRGDMAAAREAFQAAVAADASSAVAWLGLSSVAEMEGDLTGALAAARRAVVLAPEGAESQLTLGRMLGRMGRTEEALAVFARTRELAPEIEDAYLFPALLLRDADRGAEALALLEAGFERSATPRLAEQLAFVALAAGDANRALAVVEAALGGAPDRGDLILAKALALAAEPDRSSEAPDWFERALAAGVAQEGRARLEWARSLSELERWPEAVVQLDAAAALLPDEAEVFFRLAAARRQLDDTAGARSALTRYRQLDSARVAAERRGRKIGTALNEAQELAQANRLDEAVALLATVVDGDSDPRVMMLRAKVLFSLDRGEEALATAARAQELAPTQTEPSYLRALFAFSADRMSEALAAIERTLVLEPRLGEAWALRGSALARSARLAEAAESFERALALGFDSAALRLDYAGVLSALGRPEESRRQLEARDRLTGG